MLFRKKIVKKKTVAKSVIKKAVPGALLKRKLKKKSRLRTAEGWRRARMRELE